MQITHLGHSCVLLEVADQRILIDPGNFSDVSAVRDLTAVLVTHQHPDHADPEQWPGLLAANPHARVLLEPETAEKLAEVAGDELTLTWSTHGRHVGDRVLVEVGARGVDKAGMLARYCAGLGVEAADVAAFGDMPNDRGMLEWAGDAYVMPPRHPLLDGIGRTTAHDSADDGVGRTILRWLGEDDGLSRA